MTASGVATGGEPEGYAALLEQLKAAVRSARTRVVQAANNELLSLYWRLGRLIVTRRQAEGWGSRVIARLSADLHAEFPQARGFSAGNLDDMRRMATAWPDEVSLRLIGRLGWEHVQTLLDKLVTAQARDWYAVAAVEYGWTRNVLLHQIATGPRERMGAAPSNFADQLPAPDSKLAQQMTRDPLLFRFLDLGGTRAAGRAGAGRHADRDAADVGVRVRVRRPPGAPERRLISYMAHVRQHRHS